MVVIGTVKGDKMFDWHSEYLVIQARQGEMAGAVGIGRLLAEARSPERKRAGRRGEKPGPGLRYRLGAALVQLGRWLQGPSPRLPAASGS
jgi:hypothetical protein